MSIINENEAPFRHHGTKPLEKRSCSRMNLRLAALLQLYAIPGEPAANPHIRDRHMHLIEALHLIACNAKLKQLPIHTLNPVYGKSIKQLVCEHKRRFAQPARLPSLF